jgi:hypothetical protein
MRSVKGKGWKVGKVGNGSVGGGLTLLLLEESAVVSRQVLVAMIFLWTLEGEASNECRMPPCDRWRRLFGRCFPTAQITWCHFGIINQSRRCAMMPGEMHSFPSSSPGMYVTNNVSMT